MPKWDMAIRRDLRQEGLPHARYETALRIPLAILDWDQLSSKDDIGDEIGVEVGTNGVTRQNIDLNLRRSV
ncbi:hypothetical protein HYPSUDRAFT_70936 [Hypholoma sublateritium FD-334 SS-4]|uniref:Uncharacterized protein n=1 Tax=Hypholoma sublateritium (strain FD-334 SS-4) TaxID=945553 RepID=A0A0D2M1V4_HYPSF|nr:hypothetical protein HYPSUDRAFT_70936 [Hypholoma sublateritium FD-334 SS-4]